MEALVDSWAKDAQVSFLLEAMQQLGASVHPDIFKQLIAHVQAKVAALEGQNATLGGEGLLEAWAAARTAQAEAAVAKEEAEALTVAVEKMVGEAATAQKTALATHEAHHSHSWPHLEWNAPMFFKDSCDVSSRKQ
jgi:hypothetical protein